MYHLCFVCSCNSPRMVRIGVCRAENGCHPIIGRVAKLMSCCTAAQPACPDLFQNQQGYLLHCLKKFRLHRKIKTRRRQQFLVQSVAWPTLLHTSANIPEPTVKSRRFSIVRTKNRKRPRIIGLFCNFVPL